MDKRILKVWREIKEGSKEEQTTFTEA